MSQQVSILTANDADFNLQKNRLVMVKYHAENIGKCIKTTAFAIHQFVAYMKKQKCSIKDLKLVTKVFNDKIRSAIGNKQYAKNLLYTVWDVLYKNKFELLSLNSNRNRVLNLKALAVDARSVVPSKKRKISDTSDQQDTDVCLVCNEGGFVIICDTCQKCAHPDCVNLSRKDAIKAIHWHCSQCLISKATEQPSITNQSHIAVEPTTEEAVVTSQAVINACATETDDTSTSVNESSAVAVAHVTDDVVDNAVAANTFVAAPEVTATLTEAAASPEPAPVIVTSTISQKIARFSLGLQTTSFQQKSMPFQYMQYLLEMDKLVDLMSKYLEQDDLVLSANNTLVLHYCPTNETLGGRVQTRLPAFAAGCIPSDILRERIETHQWADCTADDVGVCKVFHIWTSTGLDGVALQVLGEEEAFYINGCQVSILGDVITFQSASREAKTQKLSLHGPCSDFVAWVVARQYINYKTHHQNNFRRDSMAIVDCGGKGNCFYHSALFLLKKFAPEFTLTLKGKAISITNISHAELRRATCNHLQKNYANIVVKTLGSIISCIANLDNGNLSSDEIVNAYCK